MFYGKHAVAIVGGKLQVSSLAITGPTISGCLLSTDELELSMNSSLLALGGDTLVLQDYNRTDSKSNNGPMSALQVEGET